MSIYEVTFSDRFKDYLPPDKRLLKWIAWTAVLAKPLQWLRDRCFVDYTSGAVYPFWVPILVTYGFEDIVSDVDANTNRISTYLYINKTPSIGVPTSNADYWLKLQDDVMGADERVRYCNSTLMFEYILNTYFLATYRNPPLQSDIYIEPTAQSIRYIYAADWDVAVTYAINDIRKYKNTYWKSLANSNTGNTPDSSPSFWLNLPTPLPDYDNARAYAKATLIQYGPYFYISLSATTGNTPTGQATSNANWRYISGMTKWHPSEAFAVGDVVYYSFFIYMCISANTGSAPSGGNTANTWWMPIVNPQTYGSGYQIWVPVAKYNGIGGTLSHPNKADVSIQLLAKKYCPGYMFEIIRY